MSGKGGKSSPATNTNDVAKVAKGTPTYNQPVKVIHTTVHQGGVRRK